MPEADAHQPATSHAAPAPAICVAICTRDRPRSLCETLDSIWLQTRLPEELVIIDDGRLDFDTRRLIYDRCREMRIAWKYKKSEAPGLTRARNLAAGLADSDVLLYLDDDVTCDASLIQEVARLMRDPLVAGVTATVREPAFERPAARLYQWGYRLAGWWAVHPRGLPPGPAPAVLNARAGLRRSDGTVKWPAVIGSPRGVIFGRRPLGRGEVRPGTRRARWLSGAAMALRREIVREHPFDESLAEYALGEDREYGYRLGTRYWFLQSDRVRATHRRDPSPRAEPRRLGFMTGHNYLYILHKTCRLSLGDRIVVAWSLFVLMLMHLAWSVFGDRRAHLAQLGGMIDGILAFLQNRPRPRAASRKRVMRRISAVLGRRRVPSPACPPQTTQPARALFVTNRLETGGAEQLLVSLAQRLPSAGVQPFIACLKDAGPLAEQCQAAGIRVSERLLHHKTDALAIARLRSILRECEIDVVVVAHSGGDRMFWSTLAGALTGTPVVVWSHWFPREGHRHFETANRALYRFVDTFIALGERHRDALVRHEQVPAGRIEIVRNGIDLAPFSRLPTWSDARDALRLADDHVAVALIANFRPEKRHDVFIEAARRLSRRDSRLRFFIVGDGPHREAVHAAAAASRMSHDTLRLLGPRSDVPRILRAMDICCLCSDIECSSVTMLEAAAAGCAFVGPDTGSIPEFVDHGRSGLLIRPADVVSLADAIDKLAGDPALRHRLATEARRRVFADYGDAGMAANFADVLQAIVRRKSTSRPRGLTRRASIEPGDAGAAPIARRFEVVRDAAGS